MLATHRRALPFSAYVGVPGTAASLLNAHDRILIPADSWHQVPGMAKASGSRPVAYSA
ncbi:aspartate/methionine/tyrosine aminotransferase [Xanthomonas sp. F4]